MTTDLEQPLRAVEAGLAGLGEALRRRDSAAIETQAGELHRALAQAVERFGAAARHGTIPPELRQRLTIAGGQVAAQREAMARAMAALDRAIDVLLPREGPMLYGAHGGTERSASSGAISA
jgi:hypothetical protein